MKMARPLSSVFGEFRVAFGGTLLLLVLFAALSAPLLAPHDPNEQDLLSTLLPPFWSANANPDFPLGTDSLGRCILSRLLYGARIAVIVGTLAPIGTALLGGLLAIVAGYAGGWIDWVISRAVDVWMSFPPVVLALVLMVGFSPGLANVILATILVDWTRFCRVTRSEILVVMKQDYVAAARIAGASHLSVVLRDVVPSIMPIILTLFSIEMGIAVVAESILSFVGVSVEPNIPTWGVMVADGLTTMFQAPFGLIFPISAIVLTVLGSALLGDGLRRALDPRLLERPVATA
ncbi:MAG: ABC transporter permease [Rhodospirillaceae bacterium]|nr:ABC transporter permease [Rhodospirillaceae bacterium]